MDKRNNNNNNNNNRNAAPATTFRRTASNDSSIEDENYEQEHERGFGQETFEPIPEVGESSDSTNLDPPTVTPALDTLLEPNHSGLEDSYSEDLGRRSSHASNVSMNTRLCRNMMMDWENNASDLGGAAGTPTLRAPAVSSTRRPVPLRDRNNRNALHQNKNKRMSLSQRVRRSSSYAALRRVSLATTETIQAIPETMDHILDPDATETENFDGILLKVFVSLQLLSTLFFMMVHSFPTVSLVVPTTGMALITMMALTRTLETSHRGERIIAMLGLTIIWMVTSLLIMVVTSSCTHCVYHWAQQAMYLDSTSSTTDTSSTGEGGSHSTAVSTTNPNNPLGFLWDLFLSQQDGDDELAGPMEGACRKCVSTIFVVFFEEWRWSISSWFGTKDYGSTIDSSGNDRMESINAILEDGASQKYQLEPFQNAESAYDDMAPWYLDYVNQTAPGNLKQFRYKFTNALANGGRFNDKEITEVMESFLCSPASRIDSPDPAKFLNDIKTPRFTGEPEGGLNISTGALQRIMRGDKLKDLGAALCFALRFVLFVPEDNELEHKSIAYTQLLPSTNEVGMKVKDYTTVLPMIALPSFDQDIDIQGTNMKTVERLIDIFARFPLNDKPIYFDTKEEYQAFYRWEMANQLQDAWYFPSWYLKTEKAAELAELVALKMKHANVRPTFEDATSDEVLGDNSFFGPPAKFLTPLKVPGVDYDYEYTFPGNPDRYLTDEHRDYFRVPMKPTSAQLLDMLCHHWPKEAIRLERMTKRNRNIIPLARFKDKVVEIDYAVFAKQQEREGYMSGGAILYLDAKTRKPIGIWKSTHKRMYLPTDENWKFAKLFYRTTERITVATFHVESHFGRSQAMATAAWQTLPETHGLRILTKPFTLNVHSVNWAAHHLLARNHSILHHSSGKTHDGYIDLMMQPFSDITFNRSVPQFFAESKLHHVLDTSKVPFHDQGLRVYNAHRQFVEKFIDVLYPTDNDLLQDEYVVRFWHHVNTYVTTFDLLPLSPFFTFF